MVEFGSLVLIALRILHVRYPFRNYRKTFQEGE
jgi:hypothetical protein